MLFGLYGWLQGGSPNAPTRSSCRAASCRVCRRNSNACGSGLQRRRNCRSDRQLGQGGNPLSRRARDGPRSRRPGCAAPIGQKLEFILDSATPPRRPRPSCKHGSTRTPMTIRSSQILVAAGLLRSSTSRRKLEADIAAARRALEAARTSAATRRCCRRRWRPRTFEVARVFGNEFGDALRRCRSVAGRDRCARVLACTWWS